MHSFASASALLIVDSTPVPILCGIPWRKMSKFLEKEIRALFLTALFHSRKWYGGWFKERVVQGLWLFDSTLWVATSRILPVSFFYFLGCSVVLRCIFIVFRKTWRCPVTCSKLVWTGGVCFSSFLYVCPLCFWWAYQLEVTNKHNVQQTLPNFTIRT